jgi:hypothetical protein
LAGHFALSHLFQVDIAVQYPGLTQAYLQIMGTAATAAADLTRKAQFSANSEISAFCSASLALQTLTIAELDHAYNA